MTKRTVTPDSFTAVNKTDEDFDRETKLLHLLGDANERSLDHLNFQVKDETIIIAFNMTYALISSITLVCFSMGICLFFTLPKKMKT